jgi:cell division protein FtsQ
MKLFNKILLIITVVLVLGGLIWLIAAVRSAHGQTLCKEVSIKIQYNGADVFITEKQIITLAETNGKLEQQPIDKIDIAALKQCIEKHPYASHVDIKSSIDGVLKITVTQREPIARIFNQDGESYYIDREGVLLPVITGTASRVITASGFIAQKYTDAGRFRLSDNKKDSVELASNPLFKIYKMTLYIENKPFLNALVEQIYINDKNEIEIIPKAGDQIIQFGDIDRMDEKFSYLKSFYLSAMNNGGWEKYATICLKYKNQVVCSKN